ncbi:hypothetical protein HOLDEFILI_01394 [Holdemania filiformis DSM 12042]|uniref:Uncharacterized protein n=1 Tax=Holdemania filiformis DSM 12042 TaxID=545696 RepID=B9Y6G2_9FIRM|nr:hypothetical protein HOLDEFILI_01394 [Holdemania filiformis DSM 12042]
MAKVNPIQALVEFFTAKVWTMSVLLSIIQVITIFQSLNNLLNKKIFVSFSFLNLFIGFCIRLMWMLLFHKISRILYERVNLL